MTRSTALRAGSLFVLVALASLGLGLGSQAVAAEVLFLVAASLAAVTLSFAFLVPQAPALRPVRVRRRPR